MFGIEITSDVLERRSIPSFGCLGRCSGEWTGRKSARAMCCYDLLLVDLAVAASTDR